MNEVVFPNWKKVSALGLISISLLFFILTALVPSQEAPEINQVSVLSLLLSFVFHYGIIIMLITFPRIMSNDPTPLFQSLDLKVGKFTDYLHILLFVPSLFIVNIFMTLNMKLINESEIPSDDSLGMLLDAQGFQLVLLCFVAIILAPIFEEIVFRHFIYNYLKLTLPTGFSSLLASFFFAIIHGQLTQILPLTVLGLILQLCYIRTRNLWVAISIHCLFNATVIVFAFIYGRV
ncbi:MAG: CPBP family intramembrane metalloprotease [Lentisphaeria bacterium]|nr:CPBP family intramembrane metalloprotease [Lentisphaeria bacterium]